MNNKNYRFELKRSNIVKLGLAKRTRLKIFLIVCFDILYLIFNSLYV